MTSQNPAWVQRRERAYVAAVILLGILVLAASVGDLVHDPVGVEWTILVVLTVASGWATLRIPSMPISFSISDTFIIAAALLFGPSAGALTAALDAFVLSYRMAFSRRSIHRVLFNIATAMIAIWIAAQMFFALAGSRPSLDGPMAALRLLALAVLFGAVDFGLNTGIVAVAVGFERKLSAISVWREHFLGLWVSYFGGVFGAMLLFVLARLNRFDILVLVVPLPVILYVTFRHALGRAQDQITHLGKMNRVYVAAIEALAQAVDAKDGVTHDHIRRVQDEAVRLARALDVNDEAEIQAIKAASLLHDVGKLAIPEHILNKPGRLTPAEYEIMKRHASIGADILSVIGFPYAVAPIVRHHHESWDGTGYPEGLAGDRIPIGSRIIAVVDCFDALTSDRPYRPRLSDRDASQILIDRRGIMYDARVVDAFLSLHEPEVTESSAPSATSAETIAEPARSRPDPAGEMREVLDLRACFNVGRALDRSAAASRLGDLVWLHLRERLPASAFVLYAYEATDDALVSVYASDPMVTGDRPERIPVGERLSGWVAATGQTILNSDARLDLDATLRADTPLRSALAVPLVRNGRAAGVLSFYASAPNAFDEKHRFLVAAVADCIADAGNSVTPAIDRPTVKHASVSI